MAEKAAEAQQEPAAPVAAPSAVPAAFETPDAAAMVALQRGVGNAGVVALLRGSGRPEPPPPRVQAPELRLARRPRPKGKLEPDAAAVAHRLPADRPFDWFGPAASPKLVVKRAWLTEHGVATGTQTISGEEHPEVIRPVVDALVDRYPYAIPDRGRILKESGGLSLSVDDESWQDEELEFSVARSAYLTIGLPPEMPVQVFEVNRGLEVLADLRRVPRVGVEEQMVTAMEAGTKLPLAQGKRAQLVQALKGALGRTNVPYVILSEADCNRFWGEVAWREHLTKSPASESEDGAVIFTGGGAFRPSMDISDKDRKMVEEVMAKLFGAAKPDPKAPAMQLSKGEVDLLRQLAKDPQRLAAIREMLKGAKQGGKGAPSLADALQSAAAALELREWARLLGVPTGQGSGEEPVVKRPVHGLIVNKTGELVPKQEARFSFQVLDEVDAFRVATVNVKWVAVPETGRDETPDPSKVIRREGTYYVERGEESGLNDKTFQVTFDRPGIYEIHAFVNHNFYNPAHFSIRVEVKPEKARLEALDEKAESAFGYGTGVKDKHTFTDVTGEETAVYYGLGGLALAGLAPRTGYEQGTRETGFLTQEAAKADVYAHGTASIDDEVKRLDALTKQLEAQDPRANADLLGWIKDKREKLVAARKQITDVKAAAGSHPVLCQGSYVTRANGVRGGPLKLFAWFTYDEVAKAYRAELLDRSQLAMGEDLHVKATASSFELAMEHLFFELTRVYPDGIMSFAFQAYEGTKPTDRFVRFTRKTDTLYKDVKNVAFSRPVSIAVNIAATVLTVFPPTTAAGIALSVTYNGAAAALEASDASRTGTLKASHVVNIGLVALDLLPAIGTTAKLLKTSRGFVWVVRSAQYAGQAYMLTESTYLRIKQIRDGQVTRLADLQEKIDRARESNASDPDLEQWEAEAAALRREIRTAAEDAIAETIETEGLTIAAMHTVGKLAEFELGHRGGGAAPHGATAPHETPRGAPRDDGAPAAPRDKPGPEGEKPPVVRRAPSEVPLPKGSDPHLAAGLPPELREKVRVVHDPTLKGDGTVEVHYTLDRLGLVSEVTVRAGNGATAKHVAEHARTVQLMLEYQGISGLARVVFDEVAAVLGRSGREPKVGSRAWEAKLEVEKLPRVIAARVEALARAGADEAAAARLQREIDYLKAQLERHRETYRRFDTEAGAGFVAASGDHTRAAVAEGYPPLDRAPGHFYEPKPGGGYELRQLADSPHPPKELVNENGRWTIRDPAPDARPASVNALGLDPRALGPVLQHFSGQQAIEVAGWLGRGRLEAVAGVPNDLARLKQAHDRVAPHLDDPRAARGLQRLTETGTRLELSTRSVLDILLDPEPEHVGALLRVAGDPANPLGKDNLKQLGRSPERLAFADEYGFAALRDLWNARTLDALDRELRGKSPQERRDYVRKLMDEPSGVARDQILGIPQPEPRRRVTEAAPNKQSPRWKTYLEEARTFLNDRSTLAGGRTGKALGIDNARAIEALATIMQVRDRISSAWEDHQKLSQKTKERILKQLDEIGRDGDLPTTWINNARGRVGEALYGPHGGLGQESLFNPLHPARDREGRVSGPGYTRPDDYFDATTPRPGTDKGFYAPKEGAARGAREWMEIKTDRIDESRSRAVAAARKYAADARADWDALLAHARSRGDTIVIQFAHSPGDEGTRQAMLDHLFGDQSPISAVRFGDEPWLERAVERPKARMPEMDPRLAGGPIVGPDGRTLITPAP